MGEIAITRIMIVNGEGKKSSHNVRVRLNQSTLEDHRKDIKDNCNADHVLFIYEEVEDD